ncbi:MAG: hypothetical protein H6590_03355 [Flavobacteriales bacterium]|nr:hypothetical protein [Flavobacteriales bacterium]MCB9178445.1 hypothetical protein [Flavobacteriales bacterium]
MRTIIMLALALCTQQVAAQEEPITPLPSGTPGCILNTPKEAWVGIGLSSAEVEKVMDLQTVCETECTSLNETGRYDLEKNAAVLNLYHDKLRALVGDEHYDKWLDWCAKRTGKI